MLRVGLTGGLACGKSLVAEAWRQQGAVVFNADHLGHEAIVREGPAYDAVVEEFGRDILNEQGDIERPKLAAKVFGDAARIARLNGLVHPAIRRLIGERFREYEVSHPQAVVVLEAALLLEAFSQSGVDVVVVVDCLEPQQVERYVAKGGADEDARRRMSAQFSREKRLRHADYVIDASGSREETRRLAGELFRKLKAIAEIPGPRP